MWIKKAFSDGKIHLAYARFLEHEKGTDGKPKVVKFIYRLFLDGMTAYSIVQK